MKSFLLYILIFLMSSTPVLGQGDEGVIILSDRFSAPVLGATIIVNGETAHEVSDGNYKVTKPSSSKWPISISADGYHSLKVANTTRWNGNIYLAKKTEPTTYYYSNDFPYPIYTDSSAFLVIVQQRYQNKNLTPQDAEALLRKKIATRGLVVKEAFHKTHANLNDNSDSQTYLESGYSHCFYVSAAENNKISIFESKSLSYLRGLDFIAAAGPAVLLTENTPLVAALNFELELEISASAKESDIEALLSKYELSMVGIQEKDQQGNLHCTVAAPTHYGFSMNLLRDQIMEEPLVNRCTQNLIQFVMLE